MELVALRVKIGRAKDKQNRMMNSYPDFNKLPPEVRGGVDWCYYVDQYTAWHYDKLSGFGEADDYNQDPDMQYGCFCVPKEFADAALAMFPNQVEQLEELDFEDFYDNRAHAHEVEMMYAPDVLNGLRAKYGDIPAVEQDVLEEFTDATEATKEDKLRQFEGRKRRLSQKELEAVDTLAKMTPNECKALNPDHPAPGINKNRSRFYKDFKARRGFTVAKKEQ